MFKKQVLFNVEKEEKILVLSKNSENEIVKGLLNSLGVMVDDLENDLEIINTLGKIAAKKVIFINEDKALEKGFNALFNLKSDLLVLVDTFKNENVKSFFEHLVVSSYKFLAFKSKEKQNNIDVYYYDSNNLEDLVNEGIVYGEAINKTKDLVNKPYNYLNAKDLANYAKGLEELDNIKVSIYGKKECEDMSMGSYLGVNKGSKDEPQLIHVRYTGDKDDKEIIGLVGKGVMYDTGGYSLKTTTGMPSMKCDMAGAATVLGVIEIIAKLKSKVNVDVVIAATDNRIGDDAIVPDDILTAANGMTIEILSTDAEGRLTLADALWFAQKEGATKLIDIATLTGAIVAALGKEYTGVFTNNQEFLDSLIAVSNKNKELLWQMPMSDGYRKELKSFSADMKNSSANRLAGASVAACFLENFVEKENKWIHIDIAGTAYDDKQGGTGVMVKSLADFLRK